MDIVIRHNDEQLHRSQLQKLKKGLPFLILLLFLFSIPQVSGRRHGEWDGVLLVESDLLALQAIKKELVDFRGVLRSWNNGSSSGACSGGWFGIKCVNGQVIAISLPWRGLGGRISQQIGQLKGLRRLSLHDNALAGPIPISLSFLPNLRGVYLFNNRLSGSIPPFLGNCPLLQTLDLSNNQLNGTIPPSLANSTKILRLNLSYNAISGPIPGSFAQAPSLTFLALQHNNLTGSIPDTWGSSYQLQSLTLNHNSLSGNIPASLSKLSMLQDIDLSHNALNGSLPDSFFSNLSSLVSLNLGSNSLESKIPDSLDSLRNLSVLNLGRNQFQGEIPPGIGNITSLTLLDLSQNNLTGEIPDSLENLPSLSSLNVSYNNLSGPVPSLLSKKFNSTSFIGNLELCGYSDSTPCPSPPPENQPFPPPGKSSKRRKLSAKDIILIAAGAMLVVLLLLCCLLLCCLIRKRAASASKEKNGNKSVSALASGTGGGGAKAAGVEVESGGEAGGKLVHFDGPFVFTADDLLCATAEIMGKSTYGTAYKATLEDGNQVAVKRLREKITKGQKEFEIEVAEIGKIRHPNILALRAYYLGPKGEKLLVYDYMPNGSLASFLHARGPETQIPWPTRMTIIVGITRGLSFLHTKESIVHGNLTSSNVLLDDQKNPKIADVGLSRLMTNAGNTNVIATAGTLGYRAPELSKAKNVNTKTDVFSLGIIMLELLTGKSPSEATDGLDLPQWVASIVKEEWTNEVFDVELMRDASSSNNMGDELLNTLKLALHCVDPTPGARPECDQILQKLEEINPELASVSSSATTDDGNNDAAAPTKSE
ncbi:OLC1v1033603C1 [Oldenlandia corymbosa var. corymbosa]|uniref:OLC1v1033603C1 n=1 Tax=Oldenlandia corymbosa var. corymbosa TaxID=529605 RepID=A0AAV1CRJ4_OLDCO|nr:OLC1v1033603C1 [Oldenlandia corymbosa var. corymbosa]